MPDLDFENIIRHTQKSELHAHLGGSCSIATLCSFASDIADRPLSTLSKSLADRICYDPIIGNGIDTYLKRFPATEMLVYRKSNLARVAYELIETCASEGIVNIDVRFSPDIAILWGEFACTQDAIMEIITGLEIGSIVHGVKWGLILCCLSQFGVGRASEHVTTILDIMNSYGLGYRMGIDVAGPMVGFNPPAWKYVYDQANREGLITTVHAGEALDGSHLYEVLRYMNPKRIGHGIRCIESDDALGYIRNNNTILEICPSSNIQCIQPIVDYDVMNTILKLIDWEYFVTINTDNRTISNTNIVKEYVLIQENCNIGAECLLKLIDNSNRAWKTCGKV